MPFFKKHDDNTSTKHTGTGSTARREDAAVPQAQNFRQGQNVDNNGYGTGGNVSGAPMNHAPGTVDPSYGGGSSAQPTIAGQGRQQRADYDNPQYGGNTQSLPPAGHLNQGAGQRPNPGKRMEGKVEHAVGTLVGSKALQARGVCTPEKPRPSECKARSLQRQSGFISQPRSAPGQ